MLGKLESERRAVQVRIAGEERWIAAEDGGLYRDALGVPVPSGLPDAFLEDAEEPMETLFRRYARTHVPFPTGQAKQRFGVDPTPALKRLESAGELVRGELLPGGSEREWCDPDVLRRLRRASLAVLRKEVEAADTAELAPLPRLLAERRRLPCRGRRPRSPSGNPRPAAGRRADAGGLGAGRAAAAASAPTRRPGSTSSRPAARSSGSAPGPVGRTGTGGLLFPRGCADRRAAARRTRSSSGPRARSTKRFASCSPAPVLLARPRRRPGRGGATGRRRSSTRHSGTSPGRAR